MYCKQCGSVASESANFCRNCGAELVKIQISEKKENIQSKTKTEIENKNNKKLCKKLLYGLLGLAVILVVSYFWKSRVVPLEKAEVGNHVFFGSYYYENDKVQKPIEWIVLDKEDGKVLLLSKDCLFVEQYYHYLMGRYEKGEVNWGSSDIRKFLNDSFYSAAFDDEEQELICYTQLKTIGYQGISEYEVGQFEQSTIDRVFLLSEDEVKKYFGFENGVFSLLNYGIYKTQVTPRLKDRLDSPAWLLRGSSGGKTAVACVYDNYISVISAYKEIYIRPAIWVEIED